MNIRRLATSLLTAGVLAAAPIMASALPTYTLNGNYIITGNLFIDSLLTGVGDCVQIGPGGQLVSSGAACGGGGGGGVTSVTSTTPLALTASPTTGAVSIAIPTSPVFGGTVTTGNLTTGTVNSSALFATNLVSGQCLQSSVGQQIVPSGAACGSGTVTSVSGTANQISVANGTTTPVLSIPGTFIAPGSIAATSTLKAGNLTTGDCLESVAGVITSVSTACPSGAIGSVAAGTNISITGTANAPVVNVINSPSFSGEIHSTAPATGGNLQFGGNDGALANAPNIFSFDVPTVGTFSIGTRLASTIAGVPEMLGITSPAGGNFLALDNSGNLGVAGTLASAALTPGRCVQTTTNGTLTSASSACATSTPAVQLAEVSFSDSSGDALGNYLPSINGGQLVATTWNGTTHSYGMIPVGTSIGHLNVSCAAFNAADAAAGNSTYASLDINGLGGGTISFGIINSANPGTAPLSLGSVVIPQSPQAGPWVTSVTSSVSPYSVLAGDSLQVLVSSVSGTATQWAAACIPMIGP
jgi:hypothetical protein